ncbi:hypothetical protein TBR22_A38470 [Luteitalea sp. TBR-22]|uniref:transporter n=1 Tax=Luteitalea sp. TBR-22 TaxID=2802971 RepID=UPI001AF75C36|nr:transporter [Luteitalea sp. TBR-22]BCS34619.1 hypothetical protein TBR22_A38470 [Luteitalea sp. TBR-22]
MLKQTTMVVLTAALCLQAAPVGAQAPAGVAGLLPNLILGGIRLDAGTPVPHDAHFTPLNELYVGTDPRSGRGFQVDAAEVVLNFNRLLATQFATFPIGNSSGAFSFTLDETTGLPARATRSFGPSFGERSLTVGKGRFSAGATYQHTSYDQFEGQSLDDGSIQFLLPHNDCCPAQVGLQATGDGNLLNPGFESDIVTVRTSIKASTDIAAFFATYGVTSRWDVGIAVPVMRVDLEATADAEIVRLGTAFQPLVHTFQTGSDVSRRTFTDARSASGLGDIILRSKYNLRQRGAQGIAATLDLRLPTGDASNLLGTGAAQARLGAVVSTGTDRFAQHVNVGYTFSGSTDVANYIGDDPVLASSLLPAATPPDEFHFNGGLEYAASDRVTLLGEFMGRTLLDVGRLDVGERSFTYTPQGQPILSPALQSPSFREFQARSGSLTLGLVALGTKINVGSRGLVSAHLLLPVTDGGLRSRITTTIGFDYTF